MNKEDLEIELKPLKNELVAFEQRVLALEARINQIASLIDTSSHLEIRVKFLEDFLKKQVEINSAKSTIFFKIIDLLKEKETKPEKKSIWQQIKDRIVEHK